MASRRYCSLLISAAVALAVLATTAPSAESIGVCYGTLGNNLPSPREVIDLYKSRGINRMRLYYPAPEILQALRGSGIELIMDVHNDILQLLATNTDAADGWVRDTIKAYSSDIKFRHIAVGNEVIPKDKGHWVLPAMQNVYNALGNYGLQGQVKVSTAVDTGVLGNSYPPSAGAFSGAANSQLGPIVQFLARTGGPLLVNIYPYFSYVSNPGSISLPYSLFTAPGPVVYDGQNRYQNLFDAILDAAYAAVERAGGPGVEIVVSETGWPSAGGNSATIQNAQVYNQGLINHVGKGTPRRPGREIEAYIFAMFNENQKTPQGIENNFGLFYPWKQPVYNINFLAAQQYSLLKQTTTSTTEADYEYEPAEEKLSY